MAHAARAAAITPGSNIAASEPVAVLVHNPGGGGRLGEPLLLPVVDGAVPEPRARDACRALAADNVAVRVLALDLEHDQILQGHDLFFHAQHFGDVRDLS